MERRRTTTAMTSAEQQQFNFATELMTGGAEGK